MYHICNPPHIFLYRHEKDMFNLFCEIPLRPQQMMTSLNADFQNSWDFRCVRQTFGPTRSHGAAAQVEPAKTRCCCCWRAGLPGLARVCLSGVRDGRGGAETPADLDRMKVGWHAVGKSPQTMGKYSAWGSGVPKRPSVLL